MTERKLHPDLLRRALNQLVLTPKMKPTARAIGLHPVTLFEWVRRSKAGEQAFKLTWLGYEGWFHTHCEAARKLSIVGMDANARDLAINGHSEPKFVDGEPVWQRDPKLCADALDPELWTMLHGSRPIVDTYMRGPRGELIQEVTTSPPNPQLLVKLLASLAPDIYGERVSIEHHHTGHVWIAGQNESGAPKQIEGRANIETTMGLSEDPANKPRATNVLAVPARIDTSEAFDKKFRQKLFREAVIFRDADGKVEPPLPDDVIVADSWQHRTYVEAGYSVDAKPLAQLVAAGYQNESLKQVMVDTGQIVEPPAPEQAAASADPVEMVTDEVPHVADPGNSHKPKNELRASLEAELAKLRAKGPAHPRPNATPQGVYTGGSDEDRHVAEDERRSMVRDQNQGVPAPKADRATLGRGGDVHGGGMKTV